MLIFEISFKVLYVDANSLGNSCRLILSNSLGSPEKIGWIILTCYSKLIFEISIFALIPKFTLSISTKQISIIFIT